MKRISASDGIERFYVRQIGLGVTAPRQALMHIVDLNQ
jgi:hypothetical protein